MSDLARASLVLLAVAAAGCANNARKVNLANQASLAVEAHGMWTRPTEVGYAMGGEISATAEARRILGFNVGESKPGGVSVAAILSPLTGGDGLGAVESFAAYKAVTEARAEGIYVTRIETDRNGFLFFFNRQTVTIYGRALTLEDYGPVEEARADRWRYRNYQPEAVVVKEGSVDVLIPME